MCIALLATMGIAGEAYATPAKVGPPTSIDALGDSISRGYDSQGSGCGAFADCPAFSWETGTSATVNSIYLRTKALNPTVLLARPTTSSTVGGNDAKTGAKMAELAEQAKNAVSAPNKPDQVLILMGANDVCTSSEATLTTVASFRASFKAGLEVLSGGLPDARIDVGSIPNIYNLWSVLHSSTAAQLTWAVAKICQAMLLNPTSTTAAEVKRRENVQKRNVEFNAVLGEVCAQFIHCHYDGGAAYAINFPSGDVGTLDYFHPNEHGQALAAATEWSAGPNYNDLTTPTTTITPDRSADGAEGWYRNNVTVTLAASDSEYAVAGTEYKLGEASSWTRYTGPITISSEGQTTITARSVDVNGNIEESKSALVKLDKVKPTFTLGCPTGPVALNGEASYTISNASDTGSGFAVSPDGTFPIDTATAGAFAEPVTVSDLAGNATTQTCNVEVSYPAPGVPTLAAGSTPNTGVFGLSWAQSADPLLYGSLQYTLQHRNADSEWSSVSETIAAPSFAFEAPTQEGEGTWVYRVLAHEGTNVTAFSAQSEPVVVDQTAPNAPTLTADRAPDYAGAGGWYRDSVTLTPAGAGDPPLADGSPGSGVDASSIPAPVTYSSSGSFTDTATVKDLAGNTSSATSLTVQVDATPPSVTVSCPSTVLLNSSASASIAASDEQSGLAKDPSGSVAIDTSTAGEKTITASATDNVGHTTTEHCTVDVVYPVPGVPTLSSGTTPSATGLIGLSWTPSADPLAYGSLQYTLQHRNASSEWSDVNDALGAPAFAFEAPTPEAEGTWVYRVAAHEGESATGYSQASQPVVVDQTPPAPPTAVADRAPDYAGGGGWYRDGVSVSFTANGDPALADGSPGSGVDPSSIPAAQTFASDGAHSACATVSDIVGNRSTPGCLTVRVDATPPSLQISCPATALLGSVVSATVSASDGQSGLASDPSATVAIDTSSAGAKTVTRSALDNVGHSTTSSCMTQVGYSRVITGTLKTPLTVASGEAVELAPGAKIKRVKVEAGGSLDVEGASISGRLEAHGAGAVRVCGASITGVVNVRESSGAVLIGDGAGCAASTISNAVTIVGNLAGATVVGNALHGALKASANVGVAVSGNTIAKNLTVTANSGVVVDRPNSVGGKSKLQ